MICCRFCKFFDVQVGKIGYCTHPRRYDKFTNANFTCARFEGAGMRPADAVEQQVAVGA